jgi:hypothetical protein
MRRVALHHHQGAAVGSAPQVHFAQEHPMLDIVMLALGAGFFLAGIGYAYACERL